MSPKLLFTLASLVSRLSLAQAQQAQHPQQEPQEQILTLPFYGYDPFPIAASIISADSTATTLSLACLDEEECGFAPFQTLVVGPSTYHMDVSLPASSCGEEGFTATQDCTVSASICVESAGGEGANFPGVRTVSYTEGGDEGAADMVPVTVTAGGERLSAAATGAGVMASGAQATMTTTGTTSGTATTAAVAAEAVGSIVGGEGSMTTLVASSGSTSGGSTATATDTATTTGGNVAGEGATLGGGKAEGLGLLAAIVGFLGVLV